jgi:hypothetical protein
MGKKKNQDKIGILFIPLIERIPRPGDFISAYNGIVMYDTVRDGKKRAKQLVFAKSQVEIQEVQKPAKEKL